MDPTTFADQIAATERRFANRKPDREETEQRLAAGNPFTAETPDRIRRRLTRLNVTPSLVEAVVADGQGALDAPRESQGPDAADDVVVLERLIGENDLMQASFLESGYLASRSVGRIEVRTRGGRVAGYGTGFMISPRLLMTNNHVLESVDTAAASRIEFNYQTAPDGRLLDPVPFALEPGVFFVTDVDLDYTVVAVAETDLGRLADFSWNRLIEAEGKVLLGESLNIIQHPSGEPKQLALRENQLLDRLENFLHYRTDTAPGSSGSPVFNDEWEVLALHHSGVPEKDKDGNLVALDGRPWQKSMGEAQIRWKANEGARVSRIVRALKQVQLSAAERKLRDQIFDAPMPEIRDSPERATGAATDVTVEGDIARWTVPLEVSVRVGGTRAPVSTAGRPAPAAADPPVQHDGNGVAQEPALREALDELERARKRRYYDATKDRKDRDAYYAQVDRDASPGDLYRALSRLVRSTHKNQAPYKPARLLYPWVDLRPDKNLRGIYSGKTFDPKEFIEADFEMDRSRRERLTELGRPEAARHTDVYTELDELEAAFPYNCEHVVPQSWFEKREPMRGDLHHLFACEWGCNSFRGNTPYFDFADFEEKVRSDCGKREPHRFEPSHGKGTAARAVLYFLLRYPRGVQDSEDEFEAERIETLVAWHEGDPPTEYEHHRNQAIFELQGNRNPLIDHPELGAKIDFALGLD